MRLKCPNNLERGLQHLPSMPFDASCYKGIFMSVRLFSVVVTLFVASVLFVSPLSGDDPPNIVVLFSDDAGYADFGFQPDVRDDFRNLTPRIDSIAKAGCRFSSAYMSGSVCSPSRAGLMTGRYQQRFGHDNNIPPGYMEGGLPLTETFGAKRLKELGYATGLIGKWHLGYPDEYHPNRRGFDYFYGCLQGSRKYFPIENVSPHRVFLENDTPTEETGYVTDRIGDGACRFISENKDAPFFLFVSFTATHGPLNAKQEHLDKLAHIAQPRRKKNAGLMMSMDENVGKILDRLNELGLTENTIVIFSNDNGGQTQTGANNHPLQGRKGSLWEGGIRVPMALQWPAKVASGSVVDDPVIALDWLPTFIEAAGHKVDHGWELDGISLLDRITGAVDALPERSLFWRRNGESGAIAVRRGDWKMLHLRGEEEAEPMLFNVTDDIGEVHDFAAHHASKLRELTERASSWESELSKPLWGGKPKRRDRDGKKRKKKKQ